MSPDSPADIFGSYKATVSKTIIDVVRTRHGRAAEAHRVAHTRSLRGYSTLWHDLLVDVADAFFDRGHELYKLAPAGYKVPIVNNCLVYVWRVPALVDPTEFASSPTRVHCFNAQFPDPTLFGYDSTQSLPQIAIQPGSESKQPTELEAAMSAAGAKMPLVLVKFYSSPWRLQAIDWAVAKLDRETNKVSYSGEETIWQAEPAIASDVSHVESFAAGTPVEPIVEPREQEGTDPDA